MVPKIIQKVAECSKNDLFCISLSLILNKYHKVHFTVILQFILSPHVHCTSFVCRLLNIGSEIKQKQQYVYICFFISDPESVSHATESGIVCSGQ